MSSFANGSASSYAIAQNLAVTCASYIIIHFISKKAKSRRRRRWWELEVFRNRKQHGGIPLLRDLKFQHTSGKYKNFTRMSPIDFEYLLNMIGPAIQKTDTKFRKAISVKERLSITLRFLASGDSFTSLQYVFRVSKQAISLIVPETCQAILNGLKEQIKVRYVLLVKY